MRASGQWLVMGDALLHAAATERAAALARAMHSVEGHDPVPLRVCAPACVRCVRPLVRLRACVPACVRSGGQRVCVVVGARAHEIMPLTRNTSVSYTPHARSRSSGC